MPSSPRIRIPLLVAWALAALWLAGCVTPITQEEVETRLEAAAKPYQRLGPRRIIPIYAETRLIASALLTEAKHNPESEPSVRLSRRLEIAAKRHFHVVVGGPYPELTDRLLRNALDLNRERGLPGLTLVLVSDQAPSAELAQAATSARARLVHRRFP